MDLRTFDKISEKVDAVMLSHGHWDHAGGLTKALDLIVTAKGCKDFCTYFKSFLSFLHDSLF